MSTARQQTHEAAVQAAIEAHYPDQAKVAEIPPFETVPATVTVTVGVFDLSAPDGTRTENQQVHLDRDDGDWVARVC